MHGRLNSSLYLALGARRAASLLYVERLCDLVGERSIGILEFFGYEGFKTR